jgi:hypothetical protein
MGERKLWSEEVLLVLPEIEPCNLVTILTELSRPPYAVRGLFYVNNFMVQGIY